MDSGSLPAAKEAADMAALSLVEKSLRETEGETHYETR